MTDNRAPAGAQEGHFCTGRDKWHPMPRDFCARCLPAPQPQGDRAALVEHLQARISIAEDAGVELARIRLDTLREIIAALSAPAEATEPRRCARCVGEIGRIRVTGRRGGVYCSERCADESDAEATEPPGHTDLMVSPESVPTYSPRSHFGASLREARVAAGLRLRDAAALFGVAPERYGKVERGVAEATEPKTDPFPAPGVYTQEQGEQNRK